MSGKARNAGIIIALITGASLIASRWVQSQWRSQKEKTEIQPAGNTTTITGNTAPVQNTTAGRDLTINVDSGKQVNTVQVQGGDYVEGNKVNVGNGQYIENKTISK
jgi:hypothetical protein